MYHLVVVDAVVVFAWLLELYTWKLRRSQRLRLRDAHLDVVAFSRVPVVEEAVVRPDVEADAGVVLPRDPVVGVAALDQPIRIQDVHRQLVLLADGLHDLGGDSHVAPLPVFVGRAADQNLLRVQLLLLLRGFLERIQLLEVLVDLLLHLREGVLLDVVPTFVALVRHVLVVGQELVDLILVAHE